LHLQGEAIPIFGEVDNRGNNLFVTLTYPAEIKKMQLWSLMLGRIQVRSATANGGLV
jgi:hypothetical protein